MILLLNIGIVQEMNPLPSNASPAPQLTLQFTCAVAVREQIGELCVQSKPGSVIQIAVSYCAGGEAMSDDLVANSHGEVRWIWWVASACRGYAVVVARAMWRGLRVMAMMSLYVW